MENELLQIIKNIESLEEERREINREIRDNMKEAAERDYDKKAVREIIKLRKMSTNDLKEFEFLVSKYKDLLEMN